jgi:hypothetical protein
VSILINSTHVLCTALSIVHQVTGVLKMRTYLSGMPECKLGLNDKVSYTANGSTAVLAAAPAYTVCTSWALARGHLLAVEQHTLGAQCHHT